MSDIKHAGQRLKAMNDALTGFDQMRSEIERLRADSTDAGLGIIARKLVWAITGGRLPTVEDYHAALVQCLRHKADEIERLRLTDAEREAIRVIADAYAVRGGLDGRESVTAAILRGLLERLGGEE